MPPIKQGGALDDFPLVGFQRGLGKGEFQPSFAIAAQGGPSIDVQTVGFIVIQEVVLLDEDGGPLPDGCGGAKVRIGVVVEQHQADVQRFLRRIVDPGKPLAMPRRSPLRRRRSRRLESKTQFLPFTSACLRKRSTSRRTDR